MFGYTRIVVALAVGVFCLPALAASMQSVNSVATVEPVAGQVSLSRGDGFKGIQGPTKAQVGDQVIVSTGSSAKIVYSEGCVVDVYPGHVVGVAPSCKVAMAKPMTAGMAPVVATQGFPWVAVGVGTALAVGVACIGFCGSNDDDHAGHHARRLSK